MIRSLQPKPRRLFYIAPYEQFKAAGQAQKARSLHFELGWLFLHSAV